MTLQANTTREDLPERDTGTGAEAEGTSAEESPRRWWRRPRAWAGAVAVLLLLLLTPPMVNVNRLRHQISANISASLGRPVHLDSVTLHLLPIPGFTLQNLVVSEDPAFGAEPVIRANSVDVTLRPSSLWRRRVEVSSISFDQPSLNLVRNAAGEWNVQSLLMHAAQLHSAPTAQRKAGPEPRFPYIDASEARVNVKLGEVKEPFSLTDADFALWLSSPQEWRVRLEGTPTRTDNNLTDPGTVRLEGSLMRAATMAHVPIDLTANWTGAPMGQASTLLTGNDAGWRGDLSVAATLDGTLGAARLETAIHIEDLRRAAFIPVKTMDVQAECGGTLDLTMAVATAPHCSVTPPPAAGGKTPGSVVMMADRLDLSRLDTLEQAAGLDVTAGIAPELRLEMTSVPNAWLLDWARLFSQRIPPEEHPGGTMDGSVVLRGQREASWGGIQCCGRSGAAGSEGLSFPSVVKAAWQGGFHGEIDGLMPWKPVEGGPAAYPVSVMAGVTKSAERKQRKAHDATEFILTPIHLTPPGSHRGSKPGLTLSGSATCSGYTLTLTGEATQTQLAQLQALAPPLGDGLPEALKSNIPAKIAKGNSKPDAAARSMPIDVSCTRGWGESQTCREGPAAKPKRRRKNRK